MPHACRFLLLTPRGLAIACLLPALLLAQSLHAAEPPAGQIVGGIEAVVYICGPIDPKSAKTGSDLLASLTTQQKLDLPAIRKTADYKSIYNSEVNRFLSLGGKERLAACRNAW